jgi:adenylate cyclase class 2
MEHLEVEVKFFLPDRFSMRKDILDLGARPRGRVFENNIRFEDSQKTLIGKKCLLRLRHDQKTTLTFKSKPPENNQQVKVFKELEIEVGDFAAMKDMLESLGFHGEQVYEKWRETFVMENAYFCLDTMPYGNFLEIEGSQEDIRQHAQSLGLQWEKRILANYLEIFEILKRKLDLQFNDVTFDNFKDIEVQIEDYLPLIETGR